MKQLKPIAAVLMMTMMTSSVRGGAVAAVVSTTMTTDRVAAYGDLMMMTIVRADAYAVVETMMKPLPERATEGRANPYWIEKDGTMKTISIEVIGPAPSSDESD